jgi:Rod binding domain-containing protein
MPMMTAVAGVVEPKCLVTPRLVRAAHEFEAQMMKELLKPLAEHGEDGDETGSGGALSEFAGEALGQSLSGAGGFGIGNRILASLSQTETDCNSRSVAGNAASRGGSGLK